MEEDKAAAYYEELTRKGEGAARFKQGLGFSSSSSSSSSNLHTNCFVKASSFPPTQSHATCHKQSQLQSIHNKLNKPPPRNSRRDTDWDVDKNRERDRGRNQYRDRERDRDRDRDKDRDRDRDRDRENRHRHRSSSRDRDRRSRRRSRSRSHSEEERRWRREKRPEMTTKSGVDYDNLIHGYHNMSPAERVKAKMKLQLNETAKKDANGMGSGWERFEFDKDAPLDDEEMEVADDDVALVKHIGQSFRFSTVEASRDDQIKAAHDEAMFGSSQALRTVDTENKLEQENESKSIESSPITTSLLSDKVLAGQRGSWRDRARKA